MPEIELSSDSEGEVFYTSINPQLLMIQLSLEQNSFHKQSQGDEEEVSLIVLKRPPLKELHEEVEVCHIHILLLVLGSV